MSLESNISVQWGRATTQDGNVMHITFPPLNQKGLLIFLESSIHCNYSRYLISFLLKVTFHQERVFWTQTSTVLLIYNALQTDISIFIESAYGLLHAEVNLSWKIKMEKLTSVFWLSDNKSCILCVVWFTVTLYAIILIANNIDIKFNAIFIRCLQSGWEIDERKKMMSE